MNNQRRKALATVIIMIDLLRTVVDDMTTAIEAIRDEEQEYLDAMPESLAGGDKGSAAQQAIDALDDALESLEDIDILNIEQQLDSAAQ